METAVKREFIELPSEVLEKLSALAKKSGKSLKAYMEYVLTRKAVEENISPSNDPWYKDEENIKMVESGIKQLQTGTGRTYTSAELKSRLGYEVPNHIVPTSRRIPSILEQMRKYRSKA